MPDSWLRLLYSQACSVSAKRFLIEQLGGADEIFAQSPETLSDLLHHGFTGRITRDSPVFLPPGA